MSANFMKLVESVEFMLFVCPVKMLGCVNLIYNLDNDRIENLPHPSIIRTENLSVADTTPSNNYVTGRILVANLRTLDRTQHTMAHVCRHDRRRSIRDPRCLEVADRI